MLQWLALVSMAVDHANDILGVHAFTLTSVGRFAFPAFAFLVARNASRTSGADAYLVRILTWAFVAQIPFAVAFWSSGVRADVLFSLALVLLSVVALDRRAWSWIVVLVAAGHFCDFGSVGVAFGVTCALALRCRWWWFAVVVLAVALNPLLYAPVTLLAVFCCWGSTLPCGSFFDWRPSGVRARWVVSRFFYAFYPAHLALLLGISVFPLLG